MKKELFVKALDELRDSEDLVEKIADLIHDYNCKYQTDFPEKYGMVVQHIDVLVELLATVMCDDSDLISWWCYEKNFGRDFELGDLVDGGREISLRTAEELWNYLVTREEKAC